MKQPDENGENMKKNYFILLAVVILLTAAFSALADSEKAPEAVFFRGSVTIDGEAAPIGTVIDAYDPDGIHCGQFIVGALVDSVGIYGNLAVSNDDPDEVGDQGCLPGDTVFFEVNGLSATYAIVSGNITWTSNGAVNEVNLAVTGQTVSMTVVETPNDTLVAPGWTVTLKVGIRNDGNAIDFYSVISDDDTSASPGWTTVDQDSVSHADPGATTYVYFDVYIPLFGGGGDTAFVVPYKVYSNVDTSVNYSNTVTLLKSNTDVGDELVILPDQFQLFQNYPNPFNPSTVIAFNLPTRSYVDIDIYNVLGQKVDRLVLGQLSAGINEVEYDASRLASGIYYYRLSAGDFSATKKMLLIK